MSSFPGPRVSAPPCASTSSKSSSSGVATPAVAQRRWSSCASKRLNSLGATSGGVEFQEPPPATIRVGPSGSEMPVHLKAEWRVFGERGSAKIAYTKLVHEKSSAKVSGISLQSVLLLAHHSTNCPRTALGSANVPRLPRR